MDLEFYNELVTRPSNWSEKKDKHGIPLKNGHKRASGSNGAEFSGSNVEPLGKRSRKRSSSPSSSLSLRGGRDDLNEIPIGNDKGKERNKFHYQPLNPEDQGKRTVERLNRWSKNINLCLCRGKGNRQKVERSLRSFKKLISMFSRQKHLGSQHKQDIENFQGEYKRFVEMLTLEGGLIAKLETFERRLKAFQEDVNTALKQNYGVFKDHEQYVQFSKYAKDLKLRLVKYSNIQSDFSRQSKDEIDAKISSFLKSLNELENGIESSGEKMDAINGTNMSNSARESLPHSSIISNGSHNFPTSAMSGASTIDDEKNRRIKSDYHQNVLEVVRKNMRPFYENSQDIGMVKIANKADFDKLCESTASTISEKEIQRWVAEKLPLIDICLTQKMLENIKSYVHRKMKDKPPVHL